MSMRSNRVGVKVEEINCNFEFKCKMGVIETIKFFDTTVVRYSVIRIKFMSSIEKKTRVLARIENALIINNDRIFVRVWRRGIRMLI